MKRKIVIKNTLANIKLLAFGVIISLMLLASCSKDDRGSNLDDDVEQNIEIDFNNPSTDVEADFENRAYHSSVVFDNKIWLFGGRNDQFNTLNDVWSSEDWC